MSRIGTGSVVATEFRIKKILRSQRSLLDEAVEESS